MGNQTRSLIHIDKSKDKRGPLEGAVDCRDAEMVWCQQNGRNKLNKFNCDSEKGNKFPLDESQVMHNETALKEPYRSTNTRQMVPYQQNPSNMPTALNREGTRGKTMYTLIDSHHPGEYQLAQLAFFNDLPLIAPRRTVIKGVQWVKSLDPNESGQIFFPKDFNGRIMTNFATSETLAFNGCSLANGSQLKVSLAHDYSDQDIICGRNCLDDICIQGSRAGIERHSFVHLDCPLDNDSGYFVLAKIQVRYFWIKCDSPNWGFELQIMTILCMLLRCLLKPLGHQ